MASNAPTPAPADEAPATDADLALMAQSGITRTEAYHYHVGGYRYSNLKDALAQAARVSGGKEPGA